MVKIHSFFGLFLAAFLILCLLVGVMIFYNVQSSRVQSLALESMTLLSDWNKLENKTNQILLDRYTVTGREIPPLLQDWVRDYGEFSADLEKLSTSRQILQWEEMADRFDGAWRVWRYTEVQLNNASHFFSKIIQTGLGEKVMVNGFLHTMYKMRMTGHLTGGEIFLLDDTIYALESLDNATKEFDILFTAIVLDLKEAGEMYLRRIRLMAFGLLGAAILVLGISFLINRQLKTAQASRSVYLRSQKDQLLKMICENSCEENLTLFRNRQPVLGIRLNTERPVLPLMLQIDDYPRLSHELNIREQQERIDKLTGNMEEIIAEENLTSESFRFRNDTVVFLLNVDDPEEYDGLLTQMKTRHGELIENQELSATMTIGNLNTEAIDLDHDFSDLLQLAEYRFLTGKGTCIYSGSTLLRTVQPFQYPLDRERLFEEALNSLNRDETLRILKEIIEYGLPYGPRNMRRLVLRLTASLSSVVETLERTYHIPSAGDVTPMILQVQNPETIGEVKEILKEIISRVIASCREKKEEKHDQTVLQIKAIIAGELKDFNLSADSIADRFNLTSGYVNRLFKQHTTLSISGYINYVRLDYAEELLRTSRQTVSEIAEQSGFSSMGTFFRLFKKKFGRTPREYRRETAES